MDEQDAQTWTWKLLLVFSATSVLDLWCLDSYVLNAITFTRRQSSDWDCHWPAVDSVLHIIIPHFAIPRKDRYFSETPLSTLLGFAFMAEDRAVEWSPVMVSDMAVPSRCRDRVRFLGMAVFSRCPLATADAFPLYHKHASVFTVSEGWTIAQSVVLLLFVQHHVLLVMGH
ncbi:hypothetical protein VNI00_014455 [Paramarasmius palmivorus]|uniref:Uncharacterized protein n=1 Tax=Paramarasmius palmivorus TaxID=297713 RepID=A0AAW0BTA4_9AGAR